MSDWNWDDAKQAALKILGDKGKVPDVTDNINKSSDQFDAAMAELSKVLADAEDKILAIENANDALKNAIKQFGNKVAKDNLGLDPKNKDDAAKITKAQKVLDDSLEDCINGLDRNDQKLDDLDKYLVQMVKKTRRS